MGFTSATEYKHSGCFLENGSGFFTIGFDNDEQENDFARRVCATWNACEGLETELLEGLPLNFKAHALQCADLREENTRLRAAVAEMEKMLPVLERLDESYPTLLKEACGNAIELPSILDYRQAIEIALAKRNEP